MLSTRSAEGQGLGRTSLSAALASSRANGWIWATLEAPTISCGSSDDLVAASGRGPRFDIGAAERFGSRNRSREIGLESGRPG